MHAAMTIMMMKPKNQHEPIDISMPKGTAFVAFAASSLMWTHESKAPIVQIGESQLSIKAQPVGHVVKLLVSANIKCPSLRRYLAPIGRAIIVAVMRMKFIITKTVWSFPIIFDIPEARIA